MLIIYLHRVKWFQLLQCRTNISFGLRLDVSKNCYLTLLVLFIIMLYLHTVKWFQVLQNNTNNSLHSQLRLQKILITSLQRGKTFSPNVYPWYDTKQSDDEVPVMLELWGMQTIPSLWLLPGPLRPGVVAPDKVLSMDQIELNCALILNWIAWNRNILAFKLWSYA